MDQGFLTVSDIAKTFKCHPETVKRMARTGKLPGFKFGRRWFFPKSRLFRTMLARTSVICAATRGKR
jgi:excisionase family DNA binding protein